MQRRVPCKTTYIEYHPKRLESMISGNIQLSSYLCSRSFSSKLERPLVTMVAHICDVARLSQDSPNQLS